MYLSQMAILIPEKTNHELFWRPKMYVPTARRNRVINSPFKYNIYIYIYI